MTDAPVRVLLVDDEPQILRALTPALLAEGYLVETADCGETALQRLAADPFDLLILDLGLPDIDGKEVIARLRAWSDVAIIVLSARDLETEKIAALDRGANDFVNKPVGVGELMARMRAALRGHNRRAFAGSKLVFGDLAVDFDARRVWIYDEEVKLAPREFELLRTLARHAGRPVSHRQIIAAVWGGGAEVDAQFVRVLVSQLRQKLEADPSSPVLLLTAPGVGYRLSAGNDPA
jgi:two-component system KDP operon response regulator KdpE